jgi:hypothetical protein
MAININDVAAFGFAALAFMQMAAPAQTQETAQITNRGTSSIAAYDAYLKGREFRVLRTPEDTAKAIEYYKLALEIDPEYSNAAAAMARALPVSFESKTSLHG